MAHCQRLDRESEGSYEDAPSMIRSGECVATLPIDYISGAAAFQRHEIPVANSGQQRFQEGWEFLLSEALLWQRPPSFSGVLLRDRHFV